MRVKFGFDSLSNFVRVFLVKKLYIMNPMLIRNGLDYDDEVQVNYVHHAFYIPWRCAGF